MLSAYSLTKKNQRTRFKDAFDNLPKGVFNTLLLAKTAEVCWRTSLNYLTELMRQGRVVHREIVKSMHGYTLHFSVWSKIE